MADSKTAFGAGRGKPILKGRLRRFAAYVGDPRHYCSDEIVLFLRWLRGEVTDQELAAGMPQLRAMAKKRKV